ncbi:XisI protein [Spirosoma rhododendri]|uniref:XisI protein n=1 Tax=Spirosoma rhododendri TaxID=2728024 RepID=A0A7L5DGT6_9BACT|nr:XisI protein [Spirosoma rhododendri]
MDTVSHYRQLIRHQLTEYASYSVGQPVRDDVVFDSDRDRYMLVSMGWDGLKHIVQPIIRIDIIDEKVWVQEDNTDRSVTDALVAAGIPKQAIVLGFHPEHLRQHTGYAVS